MNSHIHPERKTVSEMIKNVDKVRGIHLYPCALEFYEKRFFRTGLVISKLELNLTQEEIDYFQNHKIAKVKIIKTRSV